MAAAQVAKKLKDKRKQRTIEGIFKKVRAVPCVGACQTERELHQLVSNVVLVVQVDRDGNGTISMSEYFAIFEDHGITVNKTEVER